jgi:hypothetical protein
MYYSHSVMLEVTSGTILLVAHVNFVPIYITRLAAENFARTWQQSAEWKEEYNNFCNKTVTEGQPETMEYREDHQGETEAGIEDHTAADVAGVYKNIFFYLKWLSHEMDLAFDDMYG